MAIVLQDLITDNRFYELARYFGLKDKTDRLENKDAIMELLRWGEYKSNSSDIRDILKVIRDRERSVATGSEPVISSLRRSARLEQIDEPKLKKVKKPKVTEEPSFEQLFQEGLKEANAST